MLRSNQIRKTLNLTRPCPEILAKPDRKDYLIINELLIDPNVTSLNISKKLKLPLSTVQRRRTALERSSIIRKSYELDAKQFGWRTADILIAVEKGDSIEIANRLLTENIRSGPASDLSRKSNKSNYGSNGLRVIETSLRIDSAANIVARVIYRSSDELFHIIQEIKRMPNIAHVEWSEIVQVVGRNNIFILKRY